MKLSKASSFRLQGVVRERWMMEGPVLPPPSEDDQRWPNPNLHKSYHAKSSPDGGYYMWISPEMYLRPGAQGDIYSPNGLDELDPVKRTWTPNPNEKRNNRQTAMTFRKDHER